MTIFVASAEAGRMGDRAESLVNRNQPFFEKIVMLRPPAVTVQRGLRRINADDGVQRIRRGDHHVRLILIQRQPAAVSQTVYDPHSSFPLL